MTYPTKNLAFFSNLDGMRALCAEKMFAKKGGADTPSASLRSAAPPRGRLCAATAKLPATTKAVPLGKVASPQAMTEGV